MSPVFLPHGQFHSWIDGRYVISDVTGPWNKELVVDWVGHVYPFAQELSLTGPHVGIAVVHQSLMCPPDALEELGLAVRYSVRKLDCIAHLIVAAPSVEGREFMARTYGRLYHELCPHSFFNTMEEARSFAAPLLAARGF